MINSNFSSGLKRSIGSIRNILVIVLVLSLSNLVVSREEVEIQEEKFLGLIREYSEANFKGYDDYDIYVFSIQWGSKNNKIK